MTRTWTEINVNSDGVGVMVYEDGDPPSVIEEFWLTHEEMQDSSNHGSYTLE